MAAGKIIPLVAGNWKMNGLAASRSRARQDHRRLSDLAGKAELMVCPPATLIAAFAGAARGSPSDSSAAQDCHAEPSGAHTGDISAEMLADAGARAVIVGHSERRADHHETDAQVAGESAGRLAGGADRHRLCRGTARRTRGGQDLDSCRPSARRLTAGRGHGRQSGRCLRARLGDRNRTYADSGGCGRGSRLHPQALE